MLDRKDVLKAAGRLKPLPESTARLAHLVAGDDPDLQEIARTVEFDPVLTGAVIRVANSAAYGSRFEVGSVPEAVSRMGTGAILAIAVRAAMRGSLDRPVPEFGYAEGEFWAHCCAASLTAEVMSEICTTHIPPDAATAALVHDIGKLAIVEAIPRKKRALLARVIKEGRWTPRRAEQQLLGVDHAEIGSIIVQSWKVPETIRLGVEFHHAPEKGAHVLCDAVHLANLVARKVLVEDAEQVVSPAVRPDVLQRLGIRTAQVPDLARTVHARFRELEDSFAGAGSR